MSFQNDPNYYNFQNQQQQFMQQQQQQLPRDDSLYKLKRLDEINNNIVKVSQTLIQFFDEITKDKLPPAKIKQAKSIFEDALKHLKKVESDLLIEIGYLNMASTGHPHEGSIYGARKDYDLTRMQLTLIGSQLKSLRDSLDVPLKPDFYKEDNDGDDEDYRELQNGVENNITNGTNHINGNANDYSDKNGHHTPKELMDEN